MSYVSRISVKLKIVISIETEKHPDQIPPEEMKRLITANVTYYFHKLREYHAEQDMSATIIDHKIISVVQEKMPKKKPVHPTCHKCGANLTQPKAISRLYVSKDDKHDDATCLGHYDKDGDFEPDTSPSIPLEHHDLLDNSDECQSCGTVV